MKVKMLVFLMVMTLLIMSLSACSKSTSVQSTEVTTDSTDKTDKDKTDNDKTDKTDSKDSTDKSIINNKESGKPDAVTGRYMEKDVELPKLEENEKIIKILQNADKQFEIYTMKPSGSGHEYYCYQEAENRTWEKSKPEWLNTSNILNKNIVLIDVCVGVDGCYYTVFDNYEDTPKSMIYRIDNMGTAQNIDIAYLKEPVEKNEDKDYYPGIKKIEVLKNGFIILRDMWNEKGLLVFDSKGKKVDEIITATMQNFMVYDNSIITVNEEGKIIFYNTETKRIDKTIEYINDGNVAAGQILYALKMDGTLILGDKMGIHRLPVGGTLWETTVDGALNSMSTLFMEFKSLFIKEGDQEEYYVAYLDEKGYKLKKYVFDCNVSAVLEKEITVYSLVENNTIRQAVSLFQSKNTDVKVNYVVAMSEEGSSSMDYIRALNTELLSGNGADILVLDDLPVDSYIEKGILADISDITNPLKSSGELLESIQDSYLKDGKVYQIPIRFSVPTILGKKDAINNSDNLADIIKYIRSYNEMPYADFINPENLINNCLALNVDNLFQNGKLEKEQLISFLNNLKELSKNALTSENASMNEKTILAGRSINTRSSYNLFRTDFSGTGIKYATAMFHNLNVMSFMTPDAFIDRYNLECNTLGDRFIPRGLIGLNNSSQKGELAKQFIQFLFTKEIQDTDLIDGFPVVLSSLKNWFNEERNDVSMSMDDANGKVINATWPNKERRKEYLNKILSVNKPIVCNQFVNDMIMEHALLYLAGKEDINQATAAIISKINTYLAE